MLVAACGGAVGSPVPSASLPPEARGALEQIYVDGHAYTLQADLYRDLMPGPAPTPKRGVGGTIFLTPDRESDPPAGMRADIPTTAIPIQLTAVAIPTPSARNPNSGAPIPPTCAFTR